MKEALFYKKLKDKNIQCTLCPRSCLIPEGKKGFCRVRKNISGKLYALTYAKPCSIAIDPIEKKPFFHFYPGTKTLSIATYGCNFACDFCQNYEISQADPEEQLDVPEVFPEQIVELALKNNCAGISYTYTEPTIFFEYCYDTAKIAHEKGLYNCFVSNGYTNPEPLKKISKYLDADNVDLKGTDAFYKEVCHAPPGIKPVLETIKNCKKFGIHCEVTNLIIPGLNDSEEQINEVISFIKSVDTKIPLHFSRFHPDYKMISAQPTEISILEKTRKMAFETGIEYVYTGNVPGDEGENTYCPKCRTLLIKRFGFEVVENNLKGKKCPKCGKEIYIINKPTGVTPCINPQKLKKA